MATVHYGNNDDSHQYIGEVNHSGTNSQWLCEDRTGATVWTNLGNGTSLTADWEIHADAASGAGGQDWIEVLRGDKTVIGDCAATSGTWHALAFGIYFLDVHGDSGDDLAVKGGAGDSFAYGDAGNDYVYLYSGTGSAYGGTEADNVFGNAGSNDYLKGEAGNDCLQDDDNDWVTYDCGSGTDHWYEGDTGAKVGCEEGNEVSCCGFC